MNEPGDGIFQPQPIVKKFDLQRLSNLLLHNVLKKLHKTEVKTGKTVNWYLHQQMLRNRLYLARDTVELTLNMEFKNPSVMIVYGANRWHAFRFGPKYAGDNEMEMLKHLDTHDCSEKKWNIKLLPALLHLVTSRFYVNELCLFCLTTEYIEMILKMLEKQRALHQEEQRRLDINPLQGHEHYAFNFLDIYRPTVFCLELDSGSFDTRPFLTVPIIKNLKRLQFYGDVDRIEGSEELFHELYDIFNKGDQVFYMSNSGLVITNETAKAFAKKTVTGENRKFSGSFILNRPIDWTDFDEEPRAWPDCGRVHTSNEKGSSAIYYTSRDIMVFID